MIADLPLLGDLASLPELLGPAWPGAPEWLSGRVAACGAAAIVLFVLSLLLRGLQKILTLVIAAVIVLGGFWLAQDAWTARRQILPEELAAEMDATASRVLNSPEARAGWEAMQARWAEWDAPRKSALAGGGEPAREAIARDLEARARELQRQGKRAAAEELLRFRSKVSPAE